MSEETTVKKFIILGRLGKLCEATGPSREAVIAELKDNASRPVSKDNPIVPMMNITVGKFIWDEWNRSGRRLQEVKEDAR